MRHILTSLIGVTGILLILAGLVPSADARGSSSQRKDPCYVLVNQLANGSEVVSFDELDSMLHGVGCSLDEGGVYVKPTKTDNPCMHYAYKVARQQLRTTGHIDAGLVMVRTRNNGCDIEEDFTYSYN